MICAGALKNLDDKTATNEAIERSLNRLLQYGAITMTAVQPILSALEADPKEKSIVRIVYYLAQLALSDGSAGTPLPVSHNKGNAWFQRSL